ncbi:GtrA family protein [Sulfitobacter sp. M220]|uniref:GtrA family protein n=1 Tax=Sulfitobacter sp. M220 TaxID=2675333 RepID=UPI001F26122A|nr:GtrA family protein [Sulfitobacter sp. M220]
MRLVTCASRWPRPVWLGQLGRFAIVGLAATLTHVAVALLTTYQFALSPLQANLAGFIVAVALSFQGHLRVTFQVKAPQQYHLYRFVVLSLASLAISSLITAVGTRNGGDMRLVMAFVALIVPVASFFIARLWAFAIPGVTVPAPQ